MNREFERKTNFEQKNNQLSKVKEEHLEAKLPKT